MSPLKLITFDVTGTLLLFQTPVTEKYIEIALKYGIKVEPSTLGKNFKEAWRSLNGEHPNFGRETGLGWQNWWLHFVRKTFNGYVKPGDNCKITNIFNDLMAFHATKDAFVPRQGCEDLLKYLKRRELRLGVISNYDPRLDKILEIMNLRNYFDFVLISYDFGHPKPDGRIFNEALRLVCCKSGSEAIHVGDDLELDYLGAKNAGFGALLLCSNPECLKDERVEKSEVFPDFEKIKTYIQSLE